MGTSQSKRDARPGASLIPPWADGDPDSSGSGNGVSGDELSDSPTEHSEPAAAPEAPVSPVAAPRRYGAFRSALGRFASTGDRREARRALGHWVRTSRGGAATGTRSLGRAARSGAAALAGFSRAVSGQPSLDGALDVRSLAGLPSELAIRRIVDAFCPPGILDEELARIAMDEALDRALSGVDTFDPAALGANAVRIATLTFAAELVFVSVMGDGGKALANAPTIAAAAQRENDVRSLVREVADVVGTPILAVTGAVLTSAGMNALLSQIVTAVQEEMSSW
jgi:hypothetical protein